MAPVAADHRSHTSHDTRPIAKSGTVLSVSNEYCEYGGKALQDARVDIYDRNRGRVHRYYAVKPDGSWSGGFVVPNSELTGPTTMSLTCYADDMVFGDTERPFQILDGEATALTPTASTAPPGAKVRVTGSHCTTREGRALTSAAVYLAKPWAPYDRDKQPPLDLASGKTDRPSSGRQAVAADSCRLQALELCLLSLSLPSSQHVGEDGWFTGRRAPGGPEPSHSHAPPAELCRWGASPASADEPLYFGADERAGHARCAYLGGPIRTRAYVG